MRELPEPEGQLAWQTYPRDQVLAIQKQAYEDGLRDALSQHDGVDEAAFLYRFKENLKHLPAMLTASQKEQK